MSCTSWIIASKVSAGRRSPAREACLLFRFPGRAREQTCTHSVPPHTETHVHVSKRDDVSAHAEVSWETRHFHVSASFCLEFSPSPHPSPSSSPTLPREDVAVSPTGDPLAGLETTEPCAEGCCQESGKEFSPQFRPLHVKDPGQQGVHRRRSPCFLLCFLSEIYADGDFLQSFILFM